MTSPTDKWCCEAIRQHFENRGKRGFFIFAEPPNPPVANEPTFWFVVHAVAQSDFQRIPKPDDGDPLLLMLQTWAPVRYCPWCGQRLARAYGKHWQQLYDRAVSKAHGWTTKPSAAVESGGVSPADGE